MIVDIAIGKVCNLKKKRKGNAMNEQPIPLDQKMPMRTTDCMPEYKLIPAEFMRDSNPWVEWQRAWFFEGLLDIPVPKDGVDGDAAMRHLCYIQRSWDTKHEHKTAAVAYLASLWFVKPSTTNTKG